MTHFHITGSMVQGHNWISKIKLPIQITTGENRGNMQLEEICSFVEVSLHLTISDIWPFLTFVNTDKTITMYVFVF